MLGYIPPLTPVFCFAIYVESLQMTSFAALHLFLSLKPEYQAGCDVICEEHRIGDVIEYCSSCAFCNPVFKRA